NHYWSGRTSQNTVVVFPKENQKVGDLVDIKIEKVTPTTLLGVELEYAKVL
ncbi:MAG: TRAM domain-containing protein, partial [Flavobacteriaceae bacterium]|nr:TRAM domain-containing protein [Flavobacteriaceae bacterium]MCY4267714.1 TRAM domain-containing protein [Flavobacteriaceae bacterium]